VIIKIRGTESSPGSGVLAFKLINMEDENYNNLYLILSNQPLPNTIPLQKQQQLAKQSKHFILKNNFIYKIDRRRNNNLLRLVRRQEIEPLLYIFHNDPTSAHFATDAMFEKIRTRYYWPQMYEDIRSYVRACDACQRRGRSKKNQLLHPIPVGSPFYQIGIDFVGPLPRTAQGNRYIIVAMDYLTKWPEAKPVPVATAEQVATFLYDDIIG
jgi:integrase-like protein